MKGRRLFKFGSVALLLLASLSNVQSQGLMGGFKGHHHHRGHGAVELLLATGILAKLLNHRAKFGGQSGRNFLHALIGGPRLPGPRYPHARIPLDMPMAHPALLQDDLLDANALGSMSLPLVDNELMLNQESALLAAKVPLLMSNQESALLAARSPLLMGSSSPFISDGQLLAEAQLSQQLLAARRARRLLEARKLLAASEAKSLLAAQSEASQMLAAEELAHSSHFLAADQSRQYASSMAPPKNFVPRPTNQGNIFPANSGQPQSMDGSFTSPQSFIGQHSPQHMHGPMNNFNGQQSPQHMHGSMNNFNGQQSPQHMHGSMDNFNGQQSPQQMHGSMNNFNGQQSPQQINGSPNNFVEQQTSQQIQSSLNNFLGSQPQPMHNSINNFMGSQSPQQQMQASMNSFIGAPPPPHFQGSHARADDVLHLPPDMNEEETAQVIANLHRII